MPELHARLVAAVTARRALAEQAADGAGSGEWHLHGPLSCGCCDRIVATATGKVLTTTDDRITEHVAANDPAQILRDTEAHQRLLDLVAQWSSLNGPDFDAGLAAASDEILEALASVYPEAGEPT